MLRIVCFAFFKFKFARMSSKRSNCRVKLLFFGLSLWFRAIHELLSLPLENSLMLQELFVKLNFCSIIQRHVKMKQLIMNSGVLQIGIN